MKRPTVYIFMNKSLGMSPGKLAAQAAHAMAYVPITDANWWKCPQRTIMIMQAKDEFQLRNIEKYLLERDIICYEVIDEGVNEIIPQSITALSTEVVDKELENIQLTFATFNTYKEHYKIVLERIE